MSQALEQEAIPLATETLADRIRRINTHRDYGIYVNLMDAATPAKAEILINHFGHLPDDAVIADAGSGSGQVLEYILQEYRGRHVTGIALDISHELQERAKTNQIFSTLHYGDASTKQLPDRSVDIKYYSTSGHEIESFGGAGRMVNALHASFEELKEGGRLIIRDFAKPENPDEIVYMHILARDGFDQVEDATIDGFLDYSLLSTRALFDRFHEEFHGGNAFSYSTEMIDGQEYIALPREWAHEFYLRKDYTANWRQEIQEKYTYWTMSEGAALLEDAGFTHVEVHPDPNVYILTNRLYGKIALFHKNEAHGDLVPEDFPSTHMVLVAEKPHTHTVPPEPILPKSNETNRATIQIQEEEGTIRVGEKTFIIDKTVPPVLGTKKIVYALEGEPKRVIKIIRTELPNIHGLGKAMYQTIEREHVLMELNIPSLRIVEHDDGPPYRYLVQEAIPDDAVSARDLIQQHKLTETDIRQLAEIVNRCELGKTWQVDTNPFNWYRVRNTDGTTQMTYVDGKVYRYDEHWPFAKIGLLQWLDPIFTKETDIATSRIPVLTEAQALTTVWHHANEGEIALWKKYLHPLAHPTQ